MSFSDESSELEGTVVSKVAKVTLDSDSDPSDNPRNKRRKKMKHGRLEVMDVDIPPIPSSSTYRITRNCHKVGLSTICGSVRYAAPFHYAKKTN